MYLLSAWHVFGGAVSGGRDQRVDIAADRANSCRTRYLRQAGADAAVTPVYPHGCAVLNGPVRRALRCRSASDLGVLTALEHEQAISDPVARERCSELAGSLGDVGPAFEMQGDHRPSTEDLGDIGGVIGG